MLFHPIIVSGTRDFHTGPGCTKNMEELPLLAKKTKIVQLVLGGKPAKSRVEHTIPSPW